MASIVSSTDLSKGLIHSLIAYTTIKCLEDPLIAITSCYIAAYTARDCKRHLPRACGSKAALPACHSEPG